MDEDARDNDVIDPEDAEVETEEEAQERLEEGVTTPDANESDETTIEDESLDETIPSDDEDIEVPSADGAEPSSEDIETEEVEVAKYLITGLVDYTDEAGNIVGQLPKDSVQELPVAVGDRAVEQGQAERVVE